MGAGESGIRVDRYLAKGMRLFTRSQIDHRCVSVRVNGVPAKLSRRLHEGDRVEIEYHEPVAAKLNPEPIALDIVFENDNVVVVNKPAGMVVHPAAGNWSGTLAQALMHHVAGLPDRFGGSARPGIVHRLDKDTSGIIIAAKHPAALAELAAQFKSQSTGKEYLAIIKGSPPSTSGTISRAIARDPRNRKRFAVTDSGGKPAVTAYTVLRRFPAYCLVSLRPQTGRTHQLRVHMASLGCPILGDPIYARPDRRMPDATLALHAARLVIRLPGETEPREFNAPVPGRFTVLLQAVSSLR